jgi:hypothetical protein
MTLEMFNTCLNLADKLGLIEEMKKTCDFLEDIEDPTKRAHAKITFLTEEITKQYLIPLSIIIEKYTNEQTPHNI